MTNSKRWIAAAAAAAAALLAGAANAPAAGRCGDPSSRPWCNTSLSPDARAGLLLNALNMNEKISLLAGDDPFGAGGGEHSHTGTSDGVERVGLPTIYFSDGPVGPRQGKTTAMPVPMALAATFDTALARSHGATIANEAKFKGNDVLFAPTVNIMRTPLNGRTFEGYGEDPFLVSRLTVGWIRGAQAQGVIANVKHFAANNQEGASALSDGSRPGQPLGPPGTSGNRFIVNAVVDERTLREVYLPQFEAAVKEANVGSVMCSYNRLNGPYACENGRLLQDTLERDWRFKGFVLADYGAAHPNGTAASLNNGLDFEPWPGWAYAPAEVQLALATRQASAATIDGHIRRILRTLFAYGFFDRPAFKDDDSQIDKPAHAQVARRIEESAITLLENRRALPLNARRLRSLAIIGADADTFKTGGGSGQVTPFSFTSPREAITRRAGSRVKVSYDDGSDADRAAGVARDAQVAIVYAGDYQTEGADKRCLSLECPNYNGDQDALIEKVAAANRRTIVVLQSGGPVLTPWRNRVRGLVEAWYPGQEGGRAIARVLFGDVGPGGRLPATFPRHEGDIPTAGDPEKYPGTTGGARYKEGVLVGHRWYDARGIEPAFPFGFGLSYTRFRYSGLRVLRNAVSARVKNVGNRTGSEVPQLYLGLPRPRAGVVEPPRELKGFRKLVLRPGRSARVRFPLDARSFSYWDTPASRWAIAPGCFGVFVGRSSRDLPLRGAIRQDGFVSAGLRPVGRGLRFAFDASGPVDVDVLRVTRGRRIVRTRLVKRFAGQRASFTWRGARLGRGWYVVRMRSRGSLRRFAVERRGGRFRRRAAFERDPSCDLIRSFRLGRPVFGGRRHVALRALVRVAQRARVRVTVRRGRRVVARFAPRTIAAGHSLHVRLRAGTGRRGRYTVHVAARRGRTVVRAKLTARRL